MPELNRFAMKILSLIGIAVLFNLMLFKKSNAQYKHVILTGGSGFGKSDAVYKIFEVLKKREIPVVGFLTRQCIRKNYIPGLEVVNLETEEQAPFAIFSESKSGIPVTKKRIRKFVRCRKPLRRGDVKTTPSGEFTAECGAFNSIVRPILSNVGKEVKIVIMDQMGHLECASKYFVREVKRIFRNTSAIILGTTTNAIKFIDLFQDMTCKSEIFFSPIRRGNRTTTVRDIANKLTNMYMELTEDCPADSYSDDLH